MSVRKLTANLLTTLVIMLSGVAGAQEHGIVADPFAFDPDFRWFEPVYNMDLADMKPQKRAHNGWFATYDRLALYGSRPETNQPANAINTAESKLDRGWGHRYEIGYMLPGEDTGWLFNWTEYGVHAADVTRHEALNRYNGGQVANGSGDGSATDPRFGFGTPPREGNVVGYFYRFFDEQDIENSLSYDKYELNRTWRMEPYHYGGILEPMVGIRWMRIKDNNAFQNFQNPDSPVPYFFNGVGLSDLMTTVGALTENEMFGGQIGFRYTKFRDRFTFSSDFRVFGGGNWQCSKSQRSSVEVVYERISTTITIGDPPEAVLTETSAPTYTRNEELFVGFEVRTELAYQLTRMISLRAGVELLDIGTGVWRGGDGTLLPGGQQDQDLLLVGGTFGINLNH